MTRKSQKKRDRILDAALTQLSLHGYAKTTLDDIAKEIGLTKTALYYYFKSKEELITSLLDRILDETTREHRRIISQDLPLVVRLEQLIDWRAEFSSRMIANYHNFSEDVFLLIPFLKDRVMASKEAWVIVLTEEIYRAYPDQESCPVNPPAFAAIFDSSLHVIEERLLHQSMNGRVLYTEKALIAQFKQIVRRTLVHTEEV